MKTFECTLIRMKDANGRIYHMLYDKEKKVYYEIKITGKVEFIIETEGEEECESEK